MKALIFRNKDFSLLWAAQVLSQSGTRMYQIALMWWILSTHTDGGGKELGIFLLAGALPPILFANKIGKLIDIYKSKLLLVSSDFLAFLPVMLVAYFLHNGKLNFITATAVGFAVALLQAIIDPTLNKAIPELVEEKDIEEGVAFQSSTQSLANFGGAVLGALLIDRLGIFGVIVLNALSYFISGCCNLFLKFKYAQISQNPDLQNTTIKDSAWKTLEGKPFIKKILISFGCINFFVTPIFIILPIYTKTILASSATTLGFLEGSLWLGILAGTFIATKISAKINTVVLGGISILIFSFAMFMPALFVLNNSFKFLLFLAGSSLGITNVKFISLFHEIIEPVKKGRFFALLQALISFTFPAAFFLSGLLADFAGPRWVLACQGLGLALLGLYFLKLKAKLPD